MYTQFLRKGRDHFVNLDVNQYMILKWIKKLVGSSGLIMAWIISFKPSCSLKCEYFLDYLRASYLLKEGSVLWSWLINYL
jgi:hypothetical protein